MPIITKTRANAIIVNTVAFTPAVIGGCVLWLDGKDPAGTGTPPSNGATVTTWTDKSVSGKNGTGTGNPTFISGGGINFNSSSYFLNTSFAQNLSQRTIFIVMEETSRRTNQGILTLIPQPSNQADYQTTTGLSIETSSGFLVYGNGASYESTMGNSSLLVKAIYMDKMNGTSGAGYLNGTNQTNGTAGYTAETCSGYGVGTRWVNGVISELSLSGVIYEILFYNVPLETTDRQTIEGYLAQKWNLTSDLPPGHPGLTSQYLTYRLPDTIALTFTQKPGLQYHTSAIFPTYSQIATANLVFHLDAGNPASYSGSGSTWNDLAGSGLTTTLYGGPTYSSANGGYLMFSPSSSQYGQTSASLSVLTTFTVEVWHYFDGTYVGGQPCILTEVFLGPMNFFLGSLDGAIAPQLQFGYFPNAWNITQPPYTIPATGWYHIVGTYDGTTVKLYMNNVLIRSNNYSSTPASSNGGIRFMRRWDNPDYWGGGLAIVRIYSGNLIADQVSGNYNADKGRFGLT